MVINLRCALLGETVASRAKQTENAHSAIDFELLLLVYYVRSLVPGVVSFFSICFTVTFTVHGIRWTMLRNIWTNDVTFPSLLPAWTKLRNIVHLVGVQCYGIVSIYTWTMFRNFVHL